MLNFGNNFKQSTDLVLKFAYLHTSLSNWKITDKIIQILSSPQLLQLCIHGNFILQNVE